MITRNYDERRAIAIPGNREQTIDFAANQFLDIAEDAIKKRGVFTVALSGGNTPKPIYEKIASSPRSKTLPWDKVLLFWSDERSVPPADPDSNYRMAMEAGFSKLPIKPKQIFRMPADHVLEESSLQYENLIKEKVPGTKFDLVVLGMGDDGHIASLFPFTHALHATERLVVGNYVPQKETWRMTLTYECINSAHHIVLYVFGANKTSTLAKVLSSHEDPDALPAMRVGTPSMLEPMFKPPFLVVTATSVQETRSG
jgi:6-phosphogluconolactonase